MTAPTVEAAIHELMDFCWNVVYDLLEARDLLGGGLFVEEYTGIHSWVEECTRYTVVHSRTVAVLFVDTGCVVCGHPARGRHRVSSRPPGRRRPKKLLQRASVNDAEVSTLFFEGRQDHLFASFCLLSQGVFSQRRPLERDRLACVQWSTD